MVGGQHGRIRLGFGHGRAQKDPMEVDGDQ